MSEIVPASYIEEVVGIARHDDLHYGRADTATETMFILHSRVCRNSTPDLRTCPYSIAMDRGIDVGIWEGKFDIPVALELTEEDEPELIPQEDDS